MTVTYLIVVRSCALYLVLCSYSFSLGIVLAQKVLKNLMLVIELQNIYYHVVSCVLNVFV